MALTNQQFDQIEREYERLRLAANKAMQAKLDAAYERFPGLSKIDSLVVDLNMKKARGRIGLLSCDEALIDKELDELKEERSVMLKMAGFKNGVAEPEYSCPLCEDTGFVRGNKCTCFLKRETLLLSSVSDLEDILTKENFDNFRLDYYSDKIIDPDTKESARENAADALRFAKSFAENFGKGEQNLYLYGKTGVGKTFLSHCIAKALLDKGVNVLFVSEASLIETFEDNQFRTTDDTRSKAALISDCDLLIIDDFGTFANNSFVSTALLRCIEERHLGKKSTIITTNLSLSDLQRQYSDRIFSRIYSYYDFIYLFGEDIRIYRK